MSRPPPEARRIAATPLWVATGAVHVGAAAALIAQPGGWPWALGAVAANHAVLTAAGLWPRSQILGPNLVRLPGDGNTADAIAITIDDGPDPSVTPQVLTLLAAHGAQATFFCVGERIERYPELAQEIVRLGHSIENHSQHHRHNFSLLGPRAMCAEIATAQECIFRVTGTLPRFFRAPAGLRNPFLEPLLGRLQLRLASWTRRGFDTVTRDSAKVYSRLADALAAGDILLLHDGYAARNDQGRPVILEVLPRLLETVRAHGLKPVTLRAALS